MCVVCVCVCGVLSHSEPNAFTYALGLAGFEMASPCVSLHSYSVRCHFHVIVPPSSVYIYTCCTDMTVSCFSNILPIV